MLLDQKRNRIFTWVVAVFVVISFLGGAIAIFVSTVVSDTPAAPTAVEAAQQYVDDNPEQAEAWESLAAAHLADDAPLDALRAAQRAQQLAPDDPAAAQLVAQSFVEAEQGEKALAFAQRYAAGHPAQPEAQLLLGQVADMQGQVIRARLAYQTFLRLAPKDPQAESVKERLEQLSDTQAQAP